MMKTHKTKKRQVVRLSLRRAAEKLNCEHSHLRRVLIGERSSRSLLQRYRELIGEGAK
jgi:hypothetical protein